MNQEIKSVSELDSQDEYKGVVVNVYSDGIDILIKIKEKILQMDEKCTATLELRKYYSNRPMLVIESDFSSEHLKDILDYLSGQNVAFSSVNEFGVLNISTRLT